MVSDQVHPHNINCIILEGENTDEQNPRFVESEDEREVWRNVMSRLESAHRSGEFNDSIPIASFRDSDMCDWLNGVYSPHQQGFDEDQDDLNISFVHYPRDEHNSEPILLGETVHYDPEIPGIPDLHYFAGDTNVQLVYNLIKNKLADNDSYSQSDLLRFIRMEKHNNNPILPIHFKAACAIDKFFFGVKKDFHVKRGLGEPFPGESFRSPEYMFGLREENDPTTFIKVDKVGIFTFSFV